MRDFIDVFDGFHDGLLAWFLRKISKIHPYFLRFYIHVNFNLFLAYYSLLICVVVSCIKY